MTTPQPLSPVLFVGAGPGAARHLTLGAYQALQAAEVVIHDRLVGPDQPTYFIADIAANHDGDLDRAKLLMTLAKEAGAECAKFQHFRANTIVSDYGFKALGGQQSHQATWQKSVFETYEDASLPWEWTQPLAEHAQAIGIEFMSAPYDLEAVAHLNPYVNAFKVGSGDVNWLEELQVIADLGKPVLLATGAADLDDVTRAMALLQAAGVDIALMQCNTNYTGTIENAHHANLTVITQYAGLFPGVTLGLSDHTPGHVTVLGAVALGARVVEKHFTDDTTRIGPDHGFSMDPITWRAMVDDTRLLEAALGDGQKKVEGNESETVVLQRRCVRAARDLSAGTVLTREDLVVLRPAPREAVPAHEVTELPGRTLTRALVAGEDVRWGDLAQ
jgi:N-acetylneuraminate synthase